MKGDTVVKLNVYKDYGHFLLIYSNIGHHRLRFPRPPYPNAWSV